FLDPSEPKHDAIKCWFLSLLAARCDMFIPTLRSCLSDLFVNLEDELSSKGKASFNSLNDKMSFNFVFRLLCDQKPSSTILGNKGPTMFDLWLFLQLAPLLSLRFNNMVLNFLEDVILHTFPLPPLLIKSSYKKLYHAFSEHATSVFDEAERLGIDRDEACHNLVFLAGFNAYGGMKATLPILIKWVGSGGEDLHRRLAREIRSTVESEGGVTLAALDRMSLTKSVVYEALRIDPPVPFQYGKARQDMVVRSHDAAFEIKKGEMVFGYQPFVTKDPRVFDDPEEFVGDRFVGEGEKLLRYVYWSNGREIDDPTVGNKQCAGKDLVLLVYRVTLVELFLRYDTFDLERGSLPGGSSVTFKSLTNATSC
ncbi:allene oxide synthase 3-like, partial [Syzygium oleosum]|uniref:allene oxide synthase 3-like n=1 Tax=Syzygium oleosum TaxID=219896 RepID=UPI0024B9F472